MTSAPAARSPWSDPSWHAQVRAWVGEQLQEARVQVRSDGEQTHDQPWSTAIVFETDGGRVWFKANGPGTAHEPRLVRTLAALVPDLVPDVIAVDKDRAWSLTREAGPTLRSARPAAELWELWEQLLPRYAEAQLALVPHVPDLLATGVPERSPTTLPGLAVRLVSGLRALDPGRGGLRPEEADALEVMVTPYERWCGELAVAGVPSTVQHDDLHSNNICWGGSVAASRVIDWGDASVGHPFGTMLVTLNSIAHHGDVEVDDPAVVRVRDAYLEPFTGLADRATLVRLVDLARRTGIVARALSWQWSLAGAVPAVEADLDFPVRAWLQELLA